MTNINMDSRDCFVALRFLLLAMIIATSSLSPVHAFSSAVLLKAQSTPSLVGVSQIRKLAVLGDTKCRPTRFQLATSVATISTREPSMKAHASTTLIDTLTKKMVIHWNEGSDSKTGWALVEPDLEGLLQDKKQTERTIAAVRLKTAEVANSPHAMVIEVRLWKQLENLKFRLESLQRALEKYNPEEHEPAQVGGGKMMVLMGKDLATDEKVAIKVEMVMGEEGMLTHEFKVLEDLKGTEGFAQIKHFGTQTLDLDSTPTEYNVMVMDLLGSSIYDLWWDLTQGTRGFSEATSIALAVQMLDLLEKLHDKGYIHRDVKPDNFLMSGKGGKGRGSLRLIDFDVASSFDAMAAEKKSAEAAAEGEVASDAGNNMVGTLLYASVNAHEGAAQSYRDDLESLIYTLAFMMKGSLPWARFLGDRERVRTTKKFAKSSIMCGDCEATGQYYGLTICDIVKCGSHANDLIKAMFAHCKDLSFEEKPDYAFCRAEMMKAYKGVTGRDELLDDYDWLKSSFDL